MVNHKSGLDRDIGFPLVAVAIDKDEGSQCALKWAIDNLVSKGQTLTLIHVNTKSGVNRDDINGSSYKSATEPQMKELFLPFRCFCMRKNITCEDVVIEDTDVPKAIVEFVSQSAVEKLVLGAASEGGFVRFKTSDTPSSISKGAPDFCTVYVISKGKVQSVRNAVRAAPIKGKVQSVRNAVRAAPIISPLRAQIQIQTQTQTIIKPTDLPIPDQAYMRWSQAHMSAMLHGQHFHKCLKKEIYIERQNAEKYLRELNKATDELKEARSMVAVHEAQIESLCKIHKQDREDLVAKIAAEAEKGKKALEEMESALGETLILVQDEAYEQAKSHFKQIYPEQSVDHLCYGWQADLPPTPGDDEMGGAQGDEETHGTRIADPVSADVPLTRAGREAWDAVLAGQRKQARDRVAAKNYFLNKSRELGLEVARLKKAVADRDWWVIETDWSTSDASSGHSASESFLRETIVEKELEIRRLKLVLGAGLIEEASNSTPGRSSAFLLDEAQPNDAGSSVAGVSSQAGPAEHDRSPKFEFPAECK